MPWQKTVPKKIKIGYRDWLVKVEPEGELEDHENDGRCFKDTAVIVLYGYRLPDNQRAAEVLLHEILHALWHQWDLKESAKEEKVVTRLSVGLATVLRDNPKLLDWFITNLKKR